MRLDKFLAGLTTDFNLFFFAVLAIGFSAECFSACEISWVR